MMGKHEAKAKIDKAMLSLADERRFSEITVGEIIQLAGVNRSTCYYHYCDKYALRDAIVEEMMDSLRRSVPLQMCSCCAPEAPDIAETVERMHQQRELFLRLSNPNWEIDTLSLALRYFAGFAEEWARSQPRQGYDPELFAGLYAGSALTTVLWAFRNNVDAKAVAEMISRHFQRGFFQVFVNPEGDETSD